MVQPFPQRNCLSKGKFAIAYVKRMKGEAYLEEVSFQEDTKRAKASSEFIDLLKSENAYVIFIHTVYILRISIHLPVY